MSNIQSLPVQDSDVSPPIYTYWASKLENGTEACMEAMGIGMSEYEHFFIF